MDVSAFRQAAAAGERPGAVALLRRLPGRFLVRNAGELQPWAELERVRLRHEASGVASALAAALDQQGLVSEAVPWAERSARARAV